MKLFKLKLEDKNYKIWGETLDEALNDFFRDDYGDINIPDIWVNNKEKIIEEDISEKYQETKDIEDSKLNLSKVNSNNIVVENQLEVLKAVVECCKGDARQLVSLLSNVKGDTKK